MIVEKIAYFKCDWCLKKEQSEIEERQDPRGDLVVSLPKGWRYGGYHSRQTFCCNRCEAEYELQQAQDKRNLRERATNERA